MKTIALHLQKGGVGKTSLSGALAFELSRKGKTILIDCDPQGNASSWHLTNAPKHELASVLTGKATAEEAITPTGELNFDILPTFGLEGELKLYGETKLSDEPFIFTDLAGELARLGYEYAVLDLSPGIGRLEKSALLSADEVLTPMTPEYFALDGLEIFAAELVRLKKSFRRAPEHKAVIINAFDGRIAQHRAIAGNTDAIGRTVFRVPVDPCFRKAQALHKPIQSLPREDEPKPETLEALAAITEAVSWH